MLRFLATLPGRGTNQNSPTKGAESTPFLPSSTTPKAYRQQLQEVFIDPNIDATHSYILLHGKSCEPPTSPSFWQYSQAELMARETCNYIPVEVIENLFLKNNELFDLIKKYSEPNCLYFYSSCNAFSDTKLPQHFARFDYVKQYIEKNKNDKVGTLSSDTVKQYLLFAAKKVIREKLRYNKSLQYAEFAGLARMDPCQREECLIQTATQIIYDNEVRPFTENNIWRSWMYVNGLSVNIVPNLALLMFNAFLDFNPQLKLLNTTHMTATQGIVAGVRVFYPLLSNVTGGLLYKVGNAVKNRCLGIKYQTTELTTTEKEFAKNLPSKTLEEIDSLSQTLELSFSTTFKIIFNIITIYLESIAIPYLTFAVSSAVLNNITAYLLAKLISVIYEYVKTYGPPRRSLPSQVQHV